MNKNLEKEYKELMAENVPDLWERIEAGLEPKQPVEKKIIPWRKYSAWGMTAAAGLCLIVMIPFFLSRTTGGNLNTAPNDYQGEMNSPSSAAMQEDRFAGAAAPELNFAAEAEAAAVEGDSIDGYEEAEEMPTIYTVRARLEGISREDERTVYFVRIEGDSDADFPEENLLKLCGERINGENIDGENVYGEELVEGESYCFDFTVSTIGYGYTEYLIKDIRKE